MINILILNWSSADSVRQCLDSISSSDYYGFRIIIINNFSTAKDAYELNRIYEEFKTKFVVFLIDTGSNLGYAGGNNEGVKYLKENELTGDVLVINPDVLITKNTISEMKKALVDDVGIVTVRALNSHGEIIHDAIDLNGFFQYNVFTEKETIETDFSQGSCMLIKREIIDQIGLFDERFFLYWEEVDFSLRVKESGNKLISITNTHIIRNNNAESRQPDAFYYSVRNAKLIMVKHRKNFSRTAYVYYLFRMFLLSFKFIHKPRLFFKVIASYIYAIHDSIFNIYQSKPLKFRFGLKHDRLFSGSNIVETGLKKEMKNNDR